MTAAGVAGTPFAHHACTARKCDSAHAEVHPAGAVFDEH
jgi:hypothetical protein